jgi:hypothetical protein
MRTPVFLLAAAAGLLTLSCSKGPEPPRPGTPAFIWNSAKAAYHSGDFVKTSENLQQLVRSESEFTSRSRPWAIVISAGLSRGYSETADAYEAGARMNRANPMPFRKAASQLRTAASAAALEFAEGVHQFMEVDKTPEVTLAFDFPTGGAAEPPSLRKISAGQLIQESEHESVVRAMVQRGVIMLAGRAAGAPNDPAKTLEILKNSDAKRPRPEFLGSLAQELFDRADLYSPVKLDLPNRARMLCQEALEALQAGPETKESKALAAKVQAALKKLKAT